MLEKKFSFRGEDHSLGASYKKSMSQFFLKIFDCLADSRLGNKELPGSLGKLKVVAT